jgi:hypothetical protein
MNANIAFVLFVIAFNCVMVFILYKEVMEQRKENKIKQSSEDKKIEPIPEKQVVIDNPTSRIKGFVKREDKEEDSSIIRNVIVAAVVADVIFDDDYDFDWD